MEKLNLSKNEVLKKASEIIQKKTSDKDTLYVFSLYHSGDAMKLVAYAHHLKRFYPQDKIVFITEQQKSDMWKMFDVVDGVEALEKEEREILELASQQHCLMYGENWIIGSCKNMLLSHFPGPEGVYGTDTAFTFPNACEAYKSMLLQIPYFYPAADVCATYLDDYDDDLADEYAKSILLAPTTYSIPSPEVDFWEYLAYRLQEKGFDVYTNAYGEEKEIEGTKRFSYGMKDTFNRSRYFYSVISARSGLSDFLAFQPEMLHIVLSPEENMMNFHDISCYGKSERIKNINWNMEDPLPYPVLWEQIEELLMENSL